MVRILGLVLSFLSCLLVLCLAGRSGRLVRDRNQTVFTVAPAAQADTQSESTMLHQVLSLPAQIPGTDLIARHLVCYEGPFIEDGSDEPVTNIMALVLCNTGTEEVLHATVQLEGEGITLEFQSANILPGMSVMVLEKNRTPYTRQTLTGCTGSAQTIPNDLSFIESLQIDELDMGTLRITNTGTEALPALYLYHKNYLPDGTFVGGITYSTPIEALAPGQSVCILPDHYAAGYSRIFKAETQ